MSAAYDKLAALLGDADEVKVSVGVIYPYERFVAVRRSPGGIMVSIYGVDVAEVWPDRFRLRTAGHYTPSTRAALAVATSPHEYGRNVSMRTPGSKGGKPGPYSAVVALGNGRGILVGDEWTEVAA